MSDTSQILLKTLNVHQLFLREQLQSLFEHIDEPLRTDIVRALEEPGKLLAQSQSDLAGVWSLMTLLVAQSVQPAIDLQVVYRLAVGIECFICAVDLLDDIEDEDQTQIVKDLGNARVLNTSTALLMLAQRAITSLTMYAVDTALIVKLLKVFEDLAFSTSVGQHQDLLAESEVIGKITPEACIEMIGMKSGVLMSLPFYVGALCAGADEELCTKMASLGKMHGIACQLDNDGHDLYNLLQNLHSHPYAQDVGTSKKNLKTDLVRGKKTFPIVQAAQIAPTLQEVVRLDASQILKYQKELHESILITWGMVLLYRERARDCLQEIEAIYPVSSILYLLLKL